MQVHGHFKNKWATSKEMNPEKATIYTKLQQAKDKLIELNEKANELGI